MIDAYRSCEVVEVFQVGEVSRAGLDGGACLVEELADVAEALADRLGADAEQGGDGDLGQGVAVTSFPVRKR
jgi:hypothetical protein